MSSKSQIRVASPLVPDKDIYSSLLERAWENRIFTNMGPLHDQLEVEVAEFLGVEPSRLALVCNGTAAVTLALWSLGITSGEVVTTPYTFVATADAIIAAGCTPVFTDIDPASMNLSPLTAKRAITDKTVAILPVHTYGYPCDVEAFETLSKEKGLPVIYDAAHAFGVQHAGRALCRFGTVSTLSFHATKVFSTVEGGAVVCRDAETAQKVRELRSFGMRDGVVGRVGVNAKMSELHAAFGLATLPLVRESIARRVAIARRYSEALRGNPGLVIPDSVTAEGWNGSYFPIRFDEDRYGATRDQVQKQLSMKGIEGRKYFSPSLNQVSALSSRRDWEVPNSEKAAQTVLCLPLHQELSDSDVERVIEATLAAAGV